MPRKAVMLRSLYSGISGLRAHQTMLDVTSNNIANVNTTGFKSSSVEFEDTLSQTISAAGLPQSYKAGTNPDQVGLGVHVGAVNTNLNQGSTQSTGNNMDNLISGDGYFVTNLGSAVSYTRNGTFHYDSQGRLSTSDGGLVQGWTAVNGVISTGTKPGNISVPAGALAPAVATTTATMSGNLPDDAPVGTTITRDIPTYAADGTAQNLTVTFTANTAPSGSNGTGWSYSASRNGSTVNGSVNSTGGVATASPQKPTIGATNGVVLDLSGITAYATTSTVGFAKQDGAPAGTLLSTSMGSDGTISGTFSNGSTLALARLALATFTNPEGLTKAGDTNLQASINSGSATLGTGGSDGFGTVVSGALEASNVDLSQEFTNLIVAQRGFQANARIITTSDDMLQELTQLKR